MGNKRKEPHERTWEETLQFLRDTLAYSLRKHGRRISDDEITAAFSQIYSSTIREEFVGSVEGREQDDEIKAVATSLAKALELLGKLPDNVRNRINSEHKSLVAALQEYPILDGKTGVTLANVISRVAPLSSATDTEKTIPECPQGYDPVVWECLSHNAKLRVSQPGRAQKQKQQSKPATDFILWEMGAEKILRMLEDEHTNGRIYHRNRPETGGRDWLSIDVTRMVYDAFDAIELKPTFGTSAPTGEQDGGNPSTAFGKVVQDALAFHRLEKHWRRPTKFVIDEFQGLRNG